MANELEATKFTFPLFNWVMSREFSEEFVKSEAKFGFGRTTTGFVRV